MMNEAEQEKKQYEVRTIVEDAITSLRMAGLTSQGALKLLMIQSAIRMEDKAQLLEMLKSIERDNIIIEDDDDDDDDDGDGGDDHCGMKRK